MSQRGRQEEGWKRPSVTAALASPTHTPMIALDTETTGIDLYHSARPFLVTVCWPDGSQKHWTWRVDPLTREVRVLEEDIQEIRDLIASEDEIVLQNGKFDVSALGVAGIVTDWPWNKTHDTLIAAHLLNSGQPHDLTTIAEHYLGWNIRPFEDALRDVVRECRMYCRANLPDWAIASSRRADMPSASSSDRTKERGAEQGSEWRADQWLPAALAEHLGLPADHRWRTVVDEYANADSAVTVAAWQVMRPEVEGRGLWRIYEERMRVLPILYDMEKRGVTAYEANLVELSTEYRQESDELRAVCENVAASYRHRVPCPRVKLKTHDSKPCKECNGDREVDFRLVLPKGASNGSLKTFMFDVLNLEPIRGPKAKTDEPTVGAAAIQHYMETLPARSKEHAFVEALYEKRLRDTGIQYMESYKKFWLPTDVDGIRVLHPRLNPTGTSTLRCSSANPNEQNISNKTMYDTDSRSLRYCFGPPPGYEWWSLDAKNIELRLPAYKSGEADMVGLFEDPKSPPYYGSVHLLNFSAVFPDVWEKVLREVGKDKVGPECKRRYESTFYKWTKIGGFAIQYGAQEDTADRAFHRRGCFRLLKERFTKLEALNQECIRFADRHGYVETWPDRSIDPDHGYPLVCSRTDSGYVLPTVPFNYKTQGSAMWWTMTSMVRVQEVLDDWNRKSGGYRIVMQVHDELVFEMPRRADPRVDPKRSNLGRARELARVMAVSGDNMGVPTPVGTEYHPSDWSVGVSL